MIRSGYDVKINTVARAVDATQRHLTTSTIEGSENGCKRHYRINLRPARGLELRRNAREERLLEVSLRVRHTDCDSRHQRKEGRLPLMRLPFPGRKTKGCQASRMGKQRETLRHLAWDADAMLYANSVQLLLLRRAWHRNMPAMGRVFGFPGMGLIQWIRRSFDNRPYRRGRRLLTGKLSMGHSARAGLEQAAIQKAEICLDGWIKNRVSL